MNNPLELAQAYMRLRSREVRKNPSLLDEPDSKIDCEPPHLIEGEAS